MAIALEVIAGAGGFKVISDDTPETGVEYNSIVVMEDCEFTVFEINGEDVLAANGLSGVTIKAGSFLPAGVNAKITFFRVITGSVIAYK